MKDHLASLVATAPNPGVALNWAREYLQARILESLQRLGAMQPLAFQGGTALRFLHRIARYSEDLDFALERPEYPYDFRAWLMAIRSGLAAESYRVEVKVDDRRTVHSAFVRFPGLPHELGLSGQREEVLAVKIEVDTRPPAGAVLATTLVRRHVLLHLQHHDRASLFAGKLHAVLARPYAKGRDLYDLLWYLTTPEWPEPNLVLLHNALVQTGSGGSEITADSWRARMRERLDALDWRKVASDVRPFLEAPEGATLLTREHLLRALG